MPKLHAWRTAPVFEAEIGEEERAEAVAPAPELPTAPRGREWYEATPRYGGKHPVLAHEVEAHLKAAGIVLHDGVSVLGDGTVLVCADADPTAAIRAFRPDAAPAGKGE